MKDKTMPWRMLTSLLIGILLMASSIMVLPTYSSQPPIDTATYYVGATGQPRVVDPACAFDDASRELIFNVYEPLIFFGDKKVLPPTTTNVSAWGYSDLSMFEPVLAESMPTISEDRLNWTFSVNETIRWQPWKAANGTWITNQNLTAEDVEYTFERALVQDMGPSWILGWLLTGYSYFDEFDMNPSTNTIEPVENETAVAALIDKAITRSGNNVTFHLNDTFPESLVMQILAQSWSCIVNKPFCVEHGCWNGTFYNGWSTDYRRMPTKEYSPLDTYYEGKSKYVSGDHDVPAMCGTGPYMSHWPGSTYGNKVNWDKTIRAWRADYWPEYRGGWSAPGTGPHSLRTIIVKGIPEYSTIKMMFISGELDSIPVPKENMWDLLDPIPGITLYYDAPELSNEAMLLCHDIADDSPLMPTVSGVPQPHFFNNTHVRRAFAHVLNFTIYVGSDAIHPASWWVKGLAPDYENKSLVPHDINLTLVEDELRAAGVWESGFETYLVYALGNNRTKYACETISYTFNWIGERFKCNVVGLDLPVYLDYMELRYMPVFFGGLESDYLADPDVFVRPYMYSQGGFAYAQGYNDTYVDDLIDAAIRMPNGPERNATYQELQFIYWRDVVSLPLVQWLRRYLQRDWVRGWYYNQLYPGMYFYDLYKTVAVAPQAVDVSAVGISPVGGSKLKVTPRGWLMTPLPVTVHIHRLDSNPISVYVIVALNRTNATGYSVIIPRCDAMVVLPIGGEDTEEFLWNESSIAGAYASTLAPGNYTLSAVVRVISGFAYDNNLSNNYVVAEGGWIEVTVLKGDVNDDGKVYIEDLVLLIDAYGTIAGKLRWNPQADINGDGKVEIKDLVLLIKHYGTHI